MKRNRSTSRLTESAKIQEYIDHRRARELQILEVLDSSPEALSPSELTALVYKGTPANLMKAAEGNLSQALTKLELDGDICKMGNGSYQIMSRASQKGVSSL